MSDDALFRQKQPISTDRALLMGALKAQGRIARSTVATIEEALK